MSGSKFVCLKISLSFFSKYKRTRSQSLNVWIYLVASPILPILSVPPIKVTYFPVYESFSAVILLLSPLTERSVTIQLRSTHWNSITRCILQHGGIGNTDAVVWVKVDPLRMDYKRTRNNVHSCSTPLSTNLCSKLCGASFFPCFRFSFELVPLISWISIRRVC